MRALILLGGLSLLAATAVEAQDVEVSPACDSAFSDAASVSEYQDTHEGLFPAFSACETIEEWIGASELHPDAIDGVDPVRYAMTICAGNSMQLYRTPICKALRERAKAAPSGLTRSEQTGLLGAPLPEGAELIERREGDPANYVDPAERYRVSATAAEIAGYFSRELPKEGWTKDGTSTETALFFEKGSLALGVLINGSGGTFTLTGS